MLDKKNLRLLPIYKNLFNKKNTRKMYNGYPQLLKIDIVKNFPNNFMSLKLEDALKNHQIEFTSTSGTTSDRMQIMRKKKFLYLIKMRKYLQKMI